MTDFLNYIYYKATHLEKFATKEIKNTNRQNQGVSVYQQMVINEGK